MSNTVKTTLMLTALTVLFVFMGRLVGGNGGMLFAFGLALMMNFGAYWFSDKMALSMTGAKEVSEADAPELHHTVERLALLNQQMKNNHGKLNQQRKNSHGKLNN